MIKIYNERQIVELYNKGNSSNEIKTLLNLDCSIRQVQRIIKKHGLTRSRSEAFKLAIDKGRMTYYKRPEHLKKKRKRLPDSTRFEVLTRDNFRCQRCGATPQEGIRLEIDHKDNNVENNDISNLETLCNLCNSGKYHSQHPSTR
jgi:5-methylcytosine-specific restriction endonuclease McrA